MKGENKLTVQLIAHTPDPEKVVAAAAKLCYSDSPISTLLENLTDEKVSEFLNRLSGLGHASPTEHAVFTFAVEGVSRSLLAQITRHRIASFSVQSQRYVRLGEKDGGSGFIMPKSISDDANASEIYTQAVNHAMDMYKVLCKELEGVHTAALMEQGLDKDEAKRKASKMANEAARAVLPNACETRFIVTMNARELNSFFKLRCCNRAQDEIHALADEMLKLVYPVAPHLFANAGPGCVCTGRCTEGAMSCGKPFEVKALYENMKKDLSAGKEQRHEI